MQSTQDMSINPVAPNGVASGPTAVIGTLGDYRIIRRNGAVVAFEPSKIAIAMTKAYLAVNGDQGEKSARVRDPGASPAFGRHLPYRGRAGPGRAVADALGRA